MKLAFKQNTLIIIFILFLALIFSIEYNLKETANGSLLVVLSFWVAPIEGCIALVAIGELTKAKWISPIKKGLLSVYPLLLLFSFLFLLTEPQLRIYPWVDKQGVWLNKNFFIMRNFILLGIVYLLSRKFAIEADKESERRITYAVVYLLAFVASQSLVAFDWIMSLAYPWVSTLFGGYFFIESIYSALALSGIFYFLLYKQSLREEFDRLRSTLKDISTLIFGFSLLWAGLFYAQYLTIWYGNIPEETSFILERISSSPFREISYSILITLFFIPFIILLSRKTKTNPYIVLIISILILSGIFIERFIFLAPSVSLTPYALILEFLSIAFLFVLLVIKFLTSSS